LYICVLYSIKHARTHARAHTHAHTHTHTHTHAGFFFTLNSYINTNLIFDYFETKIICMKFLSFIIMWITCIKFFLSFERLTFVKTLKKILM